MFIFISCSSAPLFEGQRPWRPCLAAFKKDQSRNTHYLELLCEILALINIDFAYLNFRCSPASSSTMGESICMDRTM